MRALHTLREVLCVVQRDLGQTTQERLQQHDIAESDEKKVTSLVKSLTVQAAEVCDPVSLR